MKKHKIALYSIIAVGMFVAFICVLAMIGLVAFNFLLDSGLNLVYMNI